MIITLDIITNIYSVPDEQGNQKLIKRGLVYKKQFNITIQTVQINDLKMINTAYQQIDTAHVNITKALTENVNVYRKERNWYRIAAVILLVVTLVK